MLRAAMLVLLFAWIDSTAQACNDRDCDPGSGLAIDASCLEAASDDPIVGKALSELALVYGLALRKSTQPEALEMAQRAWLDYRDANCEVMSDRNGQPTAEAQAQCVVFMTGERIRELRLLSY